MPLFRITNNTLIPIAQSNFESEKLLQSLVERNLLAAFNSRLVASEFQTGALHAGRIDTLALSEDDNPVIIEYKKVESSELLNQSLFYLHWLADHHGDFEVAARHALGDETQVDWSDIRVICLAPNYKKYDLHAVQVMGANIELWRYRLFADSSLYLEEVYRKTIVSSPEPAGEGKDPVMVAAGRKAALTRASGSYTFDEHLHAKPEKVRDLALAVQEFMGNLDSAIEETPKKFYIAYKISQNIVCMEINRQQVTLYVKLDPATIPNLPTIARDVSSIGHYGTGDLELNITSDADFLAAKPLIRAAYERLGG